MRDERGYHGKINEGFVSESQFGDVDLDIFQRKDVKSQPLCAELERNVCDDLLENRAAIRTNHVRHGLKSDAMVHDNAIEPSIYKRVKFIEGQGGAQKCVNFSTAVLHDETDTGYNINIEDHNHKGNPCTNGEGAVATVDSRTEDHQADISFHCLTIDIAEAYRR